MTPENVGVVSAETGSGGGQERLMVFGKTQGRGDAPSDVRSGDTGANGLRVEDLSFAHDSGPGGGRAGSLVLEGVNLTVARGSFVSLIGRSGCGKTTLLRLVAGLNKANNGQITWNDVPIDGPGKERAIVFQEHNVLPWKTVIRNVEWGAKLLGVAAEDRQRTARELIATMGLLGFEEALPGQLSGGMRQRVGIARALCTEPDLLLMDEPFGSLDALTREQMQLELLRVLEEEHRTVLFVTHSIEEAVILSDRVAVLSGRPAAVAKVVEVALPRPRSREPLDSIRDTSEWRRCKEELSAALYESE